MPGTCFPRASKCPISGFWIVIIVKLLGKYRIIRYLGPQGSCFIGFRGLGFRGLRSVWLKDNLIPAKRERGILVPRILVLASSPF